MLPLHRRLYHHFPQWQVTPQTIYWSSDQNDVIFGFQKQLHFRTLKFSSPLLGLTVGCASHRDAVQLVFPSFSPEPPHRGIIGDEDHNFEDLDYHEAGCGDIFEGG